MNKERVAKELMMAAKDLTAAKDKTIGFNQSMWGPEDAKGFTHKSMAWLILKPNGALFLILQDEVDGRKSQKNYTVGTIDNPSVNSIERVLEKHQPTDKKSPDGYPFSKQWTAKGKSYSLKEILSDELKIVQAPLEALKKRVLRHIEKMELTGVEPLARALGVK